MDITMTTFSNWSGSVTTNPHTFRQPETIAKTQEFIRTRPVGEGVRTVGAGHSFSPVAAGTQSMLNLDHLSGLVRVDQETKRVRFLAGTRLRDIPGLLAPHGLAIPNQGDVDPQSIAGALSTSTHGTGIGFTGFAGITTGLTLVDANGELREYSIDEAPELLKLVAVSVGALGVLVEVELQCVDTFDLLGVEAGDNLEDILDSFEERARAADHFEVYCFPHTDMAQTKTNTRLVPGEPAPGGEPKARGWLKRTFDDDVVANGVFAAFVAVGRVAPQTIPTLNGLATKAISHNRYRESAHSVFVTPRRVRFHEMEYAVPLAAGPDAVRELRKEIEKRDWRIAFPFELRVTAADDVALSTSTGRESMYIATHLPRHLDPHQYFPKLEPILRAAGGRPHWGKMHTLSRPDFSELYPRFDEFCALREEMDPHWRFGSDHMKQLFG